MGRCKGWDGCLEGGGGAASGGPLETFSKGQDQNKICRWISMNACQRGSNSPKRSAFSENGYIKH
jgi:hypothetical protein